MHVCTLLPFFCDQRTSRRRPRSSIELCGRCILVVWRTGDCRWRHSVWLANNECHGRQIITICYHCCFVLHPYIQSLVCFVFPVSKRLLKWSSGTTPSEICNPLWRVDLYGRQQEPTHPPLRTGEPDELSRRPSICPSGLGIGHSEVGNGKYSEQLVFFDRSDVMMWCFF